jgi:hypothetical protein
VEAVIQKSNVRIQLAQLMQHHTTVEMGETFVDVVGGDFERLHGVSFCLNSFVACVV